MSRDRERREDGFSLAELLVTMLIVSLVLSATATLTIGLLRTNAANVSRQDQVDSARVAVETMAKTLRTSVMQSQLGASGSTADAFIQGDNFSVSFYANINNPGNTVGPSKVSYRIVPTATGIGELHQTVQIPDSPTPSPTGYQYSNTANIVDSLVAKDVLTDGRAMFSYYDGSSTTAMSTGSTGLSATDLANVLAIELTVTVQSQQAQQAQPTTYVQRMLLPNAEAVIRQGEE
ncbi:prepilin-type N-terminal cleavage/methylation domain-containing protein [Actinotalea sp. M2MS4P-6]|uniref:PulJ/GspJ family protein n=1 Tax=Actinotalea sp. M2MS4P-6 TaxID=2983762 RepID=UPI0021E3D60D|nr:prepilin-type N-terminal cleavage/methylation domain-containing protein [Actinotalea sp. M2MS4P-6]MCV2394576.1 prepilin-type N-terminal cleavage/methylation domain-containing protein [Actinotalea sp. M2MS4P-6]